MFLILYNGEIMKKPTNTDRIDNLEKTCSLLEEKLDTIIDLVTSRGGVVKEPVYAVENKSNNAKIVSGQFRPTTTDEALKPVQAEPMLMGKVPMDNRGNITDKSWKLVNCDDGSQKYIKYRVVAQNPDGSVECSDEIEDETDTFYVDQNREKLAKWRQSRGEMFNKQMSLSKKFKTEAI